MNLLLPAGMEVSKIEIRAVHPWLWASSLFSPPAPMNIYNPSFGEVMFFELNDEGTTS
jgi:hypothetical protein